MAKNMYIGVNGVARKVKSMYIGVNGVARKVKSMYSGDSSGKAKPSYTGSRLYIISMDTNTSTGGMLRYTTSDDLTKVTNPLSTPEGWDSIFVKRVNDKIFVTLNENCYVFNPSTETFSKVTTPSSGYQYPIRNIAYANGVYLAYTQKDDTNFSLFYSTNLSSWTSAGFSIGRQSHGFIGYGDSFYYVDTNGSTDTLTRLIVESGKPTTKQTYPVLSNGINCFAVFKDKLILNSYYRSIDDYTSNWTSRSVSGSFTKMYNVNDTKVVAYDYDDAMYVSSDGISFSKYTISSNDVYVSKDGKYYINKNGTISESTNLSTWTQIATGHYSTYGNDSSKSWFICETL